jgi:ribosome biogenesis GTPase
LKDLQEIGWNEYFSKQFEPYRTELLIPARVISEQKKVYRLSSEKGELIASARGILWHQNNMEHDVPVVGDWVVVELLTEKNKASIKAVLQRNTYFSRKAASGRKRSGGGKLKEQVIAANIDIAFIVVGLDRDFNLNRIDRYLVLVKSSGSIPIIILNKADLCDDVKSKKKKVAQIAPDLTILSMIALKKKEVKVLNKYISKGQTAALLGSSGVGKSTIINQLLGYQQQKVTDISSSVGKGKHATSRRELFFLPGGGMIMDNPGMREIQLWTDETMLNETFENIESLALNCKFSDCKHESEPDCAVKAAVAEGKLDPQRVKSYQKMRSEVIYLTERKKYCKR